jgi:tetratricopeptide (TPR) repeat protein
MPHLGGAFFMKLQKIIEAHRAGEIEIAISAYIDHIANGNINNNILVLLITALFQKGDIQEAEIYLNNFKTIELTNNNKNTIANLYLNANKAVIAEKYYREVLNQDPYKVDSLIGLLACFIEQEKYTDAILLYETNIEVLREIRDARYNLALAYQKIKRNEDSIFLYNEILKEDEAHYKSLLNLIGLYAENKELINSELIYNKANKLYKENLQITVSWAYALKINGKKDQALDIIEKILQVKDEVNALKLAAAIKLETNDKISALLYFKRILALELDEEIMLVVADILVEYKSVSEAASLYEILLKRNYENIKARSGYVNVKQFMCDWARINENLDLCLENLSLNPLTAMALTDDPMLLLKISTKFSESLN